MAFSAVNCRFAIRLRMEKTRSFLHAFLSRLFRVDLQGKFLIPLEAYHVKDLLFLFFRKVFC